MNFLIDIGHPAHVHLFRNLAFKLEGSGHRVYLTAKRDKNIIELLDAYGLSYTLLGRKQKGLLAKYLTSIFHLIKLWRVVKSKKIEIGIGVSGLIAIISRITGMHSICLDDDDSSITPLYARSIRNADVILTPAALKSDQRGKNHITYNGYHELAYLHPNYFMPDPSVLAEIGVKKDEPYFVLRFNAFKAHHDIGEQGLTDDQKQSLIKFLKPYGKVFISTEDETNIYQGYQLKIPPHKIHSVLYYASMFVGDSQTMCSEAGLLGTPSLKCNSLAKRLSIPNEIEHSFGLCYSFPGEKFARLLEKANELLSDKQIKQAFKAKKDKMLDQKIDVTGFLVWFCENYPASLNTVIDQPEYPDSFK
jgi:predicted glycosyltransferase